MISWIMWITGESRSELRVRGMVMMMMMMMISQHQVMGQFEDLQGCVSHCRFVPLITSCLAEKFLRMLNLPPLSTQCPSPTTAFDAPGAQAEEPGGMTSPGVKLATSSLRSGYLDDVALRLAQRKQQSKLSDQIFTFIEGFLSKSSGLQTDTPFLDSYLKFRSVPSLESILVDTLEPIRSEAERFRRTLLEAQTALRNIDESGATWHSTSSTWSLQTTLNELQRIITCLRGYGEASYEDGLTWTKCLFICSDLPLLSTCMADAFVQIPECNRTMWLKDLIIRVFTDFLDLEDCFFDIRSPVDVPVVLKEGGDMSLVEFITYQPPGVFCWPSNPLTDLGGVGRGVISNIFKLNPPCSVEVQLTSSNYMYDTLPYVRSDLLPGLGRPKCRNGSAINQVAIGWHSGAVSSAGVVPLTEQNWNQTFSIPLSAVIDYKKEDDSYLNINFTMKFIVDGNIINTTKIPVEVYDSDPVNISTCFSFNDPHIVTFDGLYYNNFYHGYFEMYKHAFLPYEVQVAYQACDSKINESCTCAVAVRSGDDVFVIDRCRHVLTSCESLSDCMNIQKIILYVNDELTPGTDIYQLDGGISYMVSLPHGTLVKIVTNREMLNVYITPSPYDLNSTQGLCGVFNEQRDDDLTLSDGTSLNITEDLDINQFIESWRLTFNNTIFDGAFPSDTQYNFGNYCQCSHYLVGNSQCMCSYSELRQACDLDLDGKFNSENITSLMRRSKKAYANEEQQTRDIDESYVPNGNLTFDDNVNWSHDDSFQHCLSLTRTSGKSLIQDCKSSGLTNTDFLPPVYHTFQGCMDDMAIADEANEAWSMSTLETLKYACLQRVYRSSGMAAAGWSNYVNETCINDCSQNGACVYGKCQCSTGYAGSDCSIADSQTPIIVMGSVSLCDKRFENCSYSTIYGQYFAKPESISCRVTPIKAVTTDVLASTKTETTDIILLSDDQIACVLPRSGSYLIEILRNGTALPLSDTSARSLTFKSYDSECYVCEPGQDYCREKSDGSYCLINNVCYASMQANPVNDCQICNLTDSMKKFYYKTDDVCIARHEDEEKARRDDKRDQDIRIGVSVGLSGLVVIITLIMLACSKDNNSGSSTSSAYSSEGSVNYRQSTSDLYHTQTVPEESKNQDKGYPSVVSPVTIVLNDVCGSPLSLNNERESEYYRADDPNTTSKPNGATVIDHTSAENREGPPMYNSAVVNGISSEQRKDGRGGQYPMSLMVGNDNTPNGSISSLRRVAMKRERAISITSAKSVGIGGGPPIQYCLNRHPSNASAAPASNIKL